MAENTTLPSCLYLVILHPKLTPYIESISIDSAVAHSTSPKLPYKILPSTAVVMGFQYRGNLNILRDNKLIPLKASGITGLQTSYRLFQGDNTTRSILIKFKPWGAAAFFNESIHLFSDQSLSLSDILSPQLMMQVEEQLWGSKPDPLELGSIIQNFLLKLLSMNTRKELKRNFIAAITDITTHLGVEKIHLIANKHGFSERNLERYFKEIVGLSPKQFSAIVRFQTAFHSLDNPRILENLGYYDQAHFIKDFKKFSGLTPRCF